eukprot:SAG22_NODE_511_length_9594_cov_4.553449_6_plen_42_part_00
MSGHTGSGGTVGDRQPAKQIAAALRRGSAQEALPMLAAGPS